MEDNRILHHPILGDVPERKQITIYFEGEPVKAYEGEPIAAALMAAGIKAFRKTVNLDEPRGIFCAIGRCTDCMMVVNGIPNVRTCVTFVEDGMQLQRQYGFSAAKEAEDR
ncbi:MAG: (2Fe-2S)-binding protein [Lachnospiraceae bacterium]|nr:(2Fe-2S)-binding protein [Lachnospiraceae bacterium]